MKLGEIKQILSAGQIQLTRSLGQVFLHDGNQLRRIADAAQLTKRDRILEVGPGLGPLTELLIAEAGEILAIEMDTRFYELLRERLGHFSQLKLLRADALEYLQKEKHDWSGWKLVANLPYSVASPILVELAEADHPPDRIVATLQYEVARRLVAAPDTDDYGVLSLLMQLRYESRGLFKIPPESFFPPPEVDSACVTLSRRAQPLLAASEAAGFKRLVKLGFSQRRKMMFKLLKQDWPPEQLTAAFERLGISMQIRAEKVSLEQFVELTKLLKR